MSSYLNSERRGEEQIGALTTIGEVSTPGSHGARTSLIRVTKDIGDISYTMVRRFRSDKQVKNLLLISCPLTRYAEVTHLALWHCRVVNHKFWIDFSNGVTRGRKY